MDKRRFWRFPCGHIGGEIVQVNVRQGGVLIGRVRQLLVFEAALTIEPTQLAHEIQLRGRLEGTMHDLRCSLCGNTRDWVLGEDALQQLIEARNERAMRPLVEP